MGVRSKETDVSWCLCGCVPFDVEWPVQCFVPRISVVFVCAFRESEACEQSMLLSFVVSTTLSIAKACTGREVIYSD